MKNGKSEKYLPSPFWDFTKGTHPNLSLHVHVACRAGVIFYFYAFTDEREGKKGRNAREEREER